MKALITGGQGFVGRHLTKKLIETGYEVVSVDSLVEGTGAIPPQQANESYLTSKHFTFIQEDCRAYFLGEGRNEKFDVIFHLAAMVGGRLMIENQPLVVAQDLSIDAEMWQWAEKNISDRVCYFSSSAAYPLEYQGQLNHRTLHETDIHWDEKNIGFPDLSYGWAKLTGEYLGKLALEKHGLKSTIYRPFSGYGSDQDLTYPFPAIMKRALEFAPKVDERFHVWGSGLQVRDFIHIDDCVERILRTWNKVRPGEALNLSTGVGTNFKELARLALDSCGKNDVEITSMSDKPEGVFYRVGDTGRQLEIDSNTKVRSIAEGVQEAIGEMQVK
jgi:GDP-L-fucose synthase